MQPASTGHMRFFQRSGPHRLAVIADTAGTSRPGLRYASPAVRGEWREQLALRAADSPTDWNPIYQSERRDVREMWAAGVLILSGTDVPVVTLATAHPAKFRDAVERGLALPATKYIDALRYRGPALEAFTKAVFTKVKGTSAGRRRLLVVSPLHHETHTTISTQHPAGRGCVSRVALTQ